MIVFDLDGTLVHSAPEIIAAMKLAWSKTVPEHPFPEERFRIGPPLPQTIAALAPDLAPERRETLSATYRGIYDSSDLEGTTPFAGVVELVSDLAARGIPMAIATNKRRVPTVTLVERWFAGYFARVACLDFVSPDDGTRPKSKVEMLEWIMAKTPVAATAAVMVGDSTLDIAAARSVGMRAIAVAWGYDDEAALTAARPDVLVRDAAALRAALAQSGVGCIGA